MNTESDQKEPINDKKRVVIVVNGRRREVEKAEVSFGEVVALGFDTPPSGPNLSFTITYRRGHGDKPEGSMVEGGSPVRVKDEMVFNVTATDRS